jgi:hypothetical protein
MSLQTLVDTRWFLELEKQLVEQLTNNLVLKGCIWICSVQNRTTKVRFRKLCMNAARKNLGR